MGNEPVTRDELLAELVAALKGTDPPEDAFSVDDIMAATGWERQRVYGYLKRAKADGTVETVGRFGALTYYRKV